MEERFVLPFEEAQTHMGDSRQSEYIIKYLKTCGAQTIIIETNYLDKDYLDEYINSYIRSLEDVGRFTKRIHFFSNIFSQGDIEEKLLITNYEHGLYEDIKDNYLGFVTIKPINPKNEFSNIGRTVLCAPKAHEIIRSKKNSKKIKFNNINVCSAINNSTNLFGIPLNIFGLPFQVQNRSVGSCATVSLWIANSMLSKIFNTPNYNLLEITEKATSLMEIGDSILLPTNGLTLRQMLNFFKTLGLDSNVINVYELTKTEAGKVSDGDIVQDIIKAFIPAYPIIASIDLVKHKDKDTAELELIDRHTVVISGYQRDEMGKIKIIYIHDDQIGPYSKVEPSAGSFLRWSNEWLGLGYDEVYLEQLFIPLSPMIKQSFANIHWRMHHLRQEFPTLKLDLYLISSNIYKRQLLYANFENKLSILRMNMPEFIWVIRTFNKGRIEWESFFDATTYQITHIGDIHYKI